MDKNKKERNHQRGFTLIEIMIVIGIMSLLFALVGPNVIGLFGDAKKKAAALQIGNYRTALDAFYVSNGFYPTNNQGGLEALIKKPTTGRIPENFPDKGYLKKTTIEKDPWGKDYIYTCENGNDYTLYSAGPDGQDGSEDDVKPE